MEALLKEIKSNKVSPHAAAHARSAEARGTRCSTHAAGAVELRAGVVALGARGAAGPGRGTSQQVQPDQPTNQLPAQALATSHTASVRRPDPSGWVCSQAALGQDGSMPSCLKLAAAQPGGVVGHVSAPDTRKRIQEGGCATPVACSV